MNAVIATTTEDHSLTLAAVLRHVELVEHVLQKVMKEGIHYGAGFPGDTKKNLLKPGADKLCLAFQLSPAFEIDERQMTGEHREYRVTCRLTTASGRVMGEGVGTCSTMENKYRWRNSARKCPDCGKESIIKGKEEYGGGWLCFPKKGGCGHKWPDGAKVIESQDGGKVENPDIADVFNTCLKIGKKRAYVDATITATAASDLFTQDIEDLQATAEAEERKAEARQASAQPLVTTHPTTTRDAGSHTEHRRVTDVHGTTPAHIQAGVDAVTRPAASGKPTREDCEKLFVEVKRAIGERPAAAVWKPFGSDFAARHAGFTAIIKATAEIVRIVGQERGGQIVGDCVDHHGNDQMKNVTAFIDELVRLSHGEVMEHQAVTVGAENPRAGAPGVADEEPPY